MQPVFQIMGAAMAASVLAITPATAATVAVDLSGATTGATINGVGASFAQGFTFGPLALSPGDAILVDFFDPGVSAAANSLLSPPANQGPLAMLLAGNVANSLTFTAGSASGGSVTITGYDLSGAMTGSALLNFADGYSVYTINSLGNFAGVQFATNDDPFGVRYMNFSYESLSGGVPEPGAWLMLILGFMAIGVALRSHKPRVELTYA